MAIVSGVSRAINQIKFSEITRSINPTSKFMKYHRYTYMLSSFLMRAFLLAIIYMLLAVMTGQAQQVSLKARKAPLEQVLKDLRRQSGYAFLFREEYLRNALPVTIEVQKTEILEVLPIIFREQPFEYEINKKVITIVPKNERGKNGEKQETGQKIRGHVTDSAGTPLPGVTIRVKYSVKSAITNSAGDFVLEEVGTNDILLLSLLGYEDKTVKTSGNNTVTIALKPVSTKLDEALVIGYGTTTRRMNTGSVGKLSAKEISDQPVTNVLSALSGRIPGVFVQTSNGLPGGEVKIQVRGRQSIAAGTEPLFIVDGVPFSSTSLTFNNSNFSFLNGAVSPLNSLSPNDIASIEVLKDADATAIYGSRGANGVILITTKKGTKGSPIFTADISQGFNRISRKATMLNLSQYLMLRREAFRNEGAEPSADPLSPNYAPDLMVWDTTRSTDWQDYAFGKVAPLTNIQTSFSGGSDQTRFLFGLNYHGEGTVMQGDQKYNRYGGILSIDHTSVNQRFNIQTTVNYSRDDNRTLKSLSAAGIYSLPPNFPVYQPDGKLNWALRLNPEAYLMQNATNKTDNLIANTVLSYKILTDLQLKASGGYTTMGMQVWSKDPASAQNPSGSQPATNSASFGNQRTRTFLAEPQILYSKKTNIGDLSGLLGFSWQKTESSGEFLNATDYANDLFLDNIGAAGQVTAYNIRSIYKYASLFFRFSYNYNKKYLFNINLRRDGSSRFGEDNRFGNFGAIGAAWIFSEEQKVKEALPFLSFGKIRASWGIVGNDQIPDYQYMATYGNGNDYLNIKTLVPKTISNANYKWEATKKIEGALDLGFFNDRLSTSIAWYHHQSDNQLVAYPIPFLSGPFGSYQANLPALVRNTGLEIEVGGQPVRSEKFSWQSNLNISFPKNKLVSYPGLEYSSYANQYIVGEDLSNVKMYRFLGIDPQTGLPIAEDVDGDGNITYPIDLAAPRGKTSPDFYGGWSNQFRYGGLSLDIFLQFVKQTSLIDLPVYLPPGAMSNKLTTALDRWRQPGDITDIPRAYLPSNGKAGSILSYLSTSNMAMKDASYMRLKNIAIRYRLPAKFAQSMHVSSLEIYALAQNLLTWSPIKAVDPEVTTLLTGVPTLRSMTLGITLKL